MSAGVVDPPLLLHLSWLVTWTSYEKNCGSSIFQFNATFFNYIYQIVIMNCLVNTILHQMLNNKASDNKNSQKKKKFNILNLAHLLSHGPTDL